MLSGRPKMVLFYLLMAVLATGGITAVYAARVGYRTRSVYRYVKGHYRGWSGEVHRSDSILGFAPIPGSRGAHVFPIGPDIPMRYDEHGFRAPVWETRQQVPAHPVVMTLGCSVTYGDATAAENTYPYLVGALLGGSTENAGVCSYGLSQMMILARRLVPTYRPDYLLVQYSPWLVDRALQPFAPMYYGKLPNPYFAGADELAVQRPVFSTIVFDLRIDRYRESPSGFMDFLSFVWNVGIPLFVHDDADMVRYRWEVLWGRIRPPATDRDAVIRYAYGQIAAVAKEYDVRVVIVGLGSEETGLEVPTQLLPEGVPIINAQEQLVRCLATPSADAYKRRYMHWRGSPPTMVDRHPNEEAHRIIARAIVAGIRGRQAPLEVGASASERSPCTG